jgi:hypothetical protein
MKSSKPNRAFQWVAAILLCASVIFLVLAPNAHDIFGISRKVLLFIIAFSIFAGLIIRRFVVGRRYSGGEKADISIRRARHLLFPPAVKWIGFGIALAGTVLLIVLREPRMWSAMIGGLWVAMWSRDGLEDEMLREVRLSAAWFALSFVALYVAVLNIMPPVRFSATAVVFIVMLYYNIVLWTFKWRISRENKEN